MDGENGSRHSVHAPAPPAGQLSSPNRVHGAGYLLIAHSPFDRSYQICAVNPRYPLGARHRRSAGPPTKALYYLQNNGSSGLSTNKSSTGRRVGKLHTAAGAAKIKEHLARNVQIQAGG